MSLSIKTATAENAKPYPTHSNTLFKTIRDPTRPIQNETQYIHDIKSKSPPERFCEAAAAAGNPDLDRIIADASKDDLLRAVFQAGTLMALKAARGEKVNLSI